MWYINYTDDRYSKLLSMCITGLVFQTTLRHPTDEDDNIEPLKTPPTAVRSSRSVAWSAVIEDIDTYFANEGKHISEFAVT